MLPFIPPFAIRLARLFSAEKVFYGFLALALALLAGPARAGCIVSDALSGPVGGQSSAPSWSHTVGAGSNRALVVTLVTTGGTTISSLNYGAQAMTAQVSVGDGANQEHIFVYTLLNPLSGAHTITVSFSGTPIYVAGAQSFSGVSAIGAVNSATVSAFSNTGSLTTGQANSVIAGVVSAVNNQNTTFTFSNGSGQSTSWSGTGSNGALVNGEQFYDQAGAAGANSLAFSFLPGSGFNTPASSVGLVELTPASCGTNTSTPTVSPSPTASPIVSPTPTSSPAPSICPTWVANGSAVVAAPGKNILTGENTSGNGSPEAGSIWSNACLNLSADFNKTFKIYLGNDNAGTSGMGFVLQKTGTAALGGCGTGLGFGAGACGGSAINNSLEVEIRTESTAGAAVNGTLAIDENGAITQNGCPSVSGSCPINALASGATIKDGQEHTFQLIWTASTHVLQVYFDGALRLTYTKDIVASLFGGTSCVTYGFTGGTDTTGNLQYFYDPNCAIVPSSCTNWLLQGSAAYTAPNQIQETPDNPWLVAAAWSPVCVNLNSNFDFNYQVYLGSNAGTSGTGGADGMTFMLQTQGTAALGALGGALGIQGLSPSVAVEIDTYQNGGEPTYDHIAVDENGSATHGGAAAVQASATQPDVKDGALHTFEVKWVASTHTMTVFFDGSLRLTYTKDIVNLIFGGANCVTYGYTGATGFKTDKQYFIDNNCVLTPTPTTSPSGTPTVTLTPSPSPTRTPTPSMTTSPTPSMTVSPLPTLTSSPTMTISPSPSATPVMGITKTVNASSATIGDTLTYCLNWKNDSSGAVTMLLWDTVSPFLTYVGCDNGCASSAGMVSWNLGSKAPAATGVVCFWARVSGYPP